MFSKTNNIILFLKNDASQSQLKTREKLKLMRNIILHFATWKSLVKYLFLKLFILVSENSFWSVSYKEQKVPSEFHHQSRSMFAHFKRKTIAIGK